MSDEANVPASIMREGQYDGRKNFLTPGCPESRDDLAIFP